MKAFHEAGGRYVLVKETTPNVFDSIAENLTKADAERIVAIETALQALVDGANRGTLEAAPHKRTEGQTLIAQAVAALKT